MPTKYKVVVNLIDGSVKDFQFIISSGCSTDEVAVIAHKKVIDNFGESERFDVFKEE